MDCYLSLRRKLYTHLWLFPKFYPSSLLFPGNSIFLDWSALLHCAASRLCLYENSAIFWFIYRNLLLMSNLFLKYYSFWNCLSIFLARRIQPSWFILVILLGRKWGGVLVSSMYVFFTTGKRCWRMEKCAIFWNFITWNRREKRQFQMFILIEYLLNWLFCSKE